MILYKRIFTIAILLLTAGTVFGQTKTMFAGDKLPEISFSGVFNYKSDSLATKDLKGKMIILEFWGTSCIPCLESFPKLDSIQKAHGKEVQIILVNSQSKPVIEKFFKTHPGVFLPNLPFITSDTLLHKMFPHYGNPHSVWISKNAEFMHESLPINAFNTDAILKGMPLNIPENIRREFRSSLFEEKWRKSVLSSSIVVRGDQLGLALKRDEQSLSFSDQGTIAYLFQTAYNGLRNEILFTRPQRTVLEVANPTNYNKPKGLSAYEAQQWSKQFIYSYQSVYPKESKANIWKIMSEDLERSFNIKAFVERRLVKSVVLVNDNQISKLKTKGAEALDTFNPAVVSDQKFYKTKKLINQPYTKLTKMVRAIVETKLQRSFVDETNYTGNIDISVKATALDDFSIDRFNAEVRKYGIKLVEKEIPMDVLVLKEI